MPTLRPGSRMCQCSACGRFFSGDRSFDMHRMGRYEPDERHCLTPVEMEAKGLVDRDGVWGRPGSGAPHWTQVEEEAV